MGEFLAHSTAVWLNPHPSLGRLRKDPEMTVFGERARWKHDLIGSQTQPLAPPSGLRGPLGGVGTPR